MTPEQITELAEKAGLDISGHMVWCAVHELKVFANLVRNATLEEAAKLCDGMQPIPASEPRHCAQDIRSLKT